MTTDTPITFFHGQTLDGHRWVLSFEGGPTACEPGARCVVSGHLPTFAGHVKPRGLTVEQGSELRAMLPYVERAEVPALLGEVRAL